MSGENLRSGRKTCFVNNTEGCIDPHFICHRRFVTPYGGKSHIRDGVVSCYDRRIKADSIHSRVSMNNKHDGAVSDENSRLARTYEGEEEEEQFDTLISVKA